MVIFEFWKKKSKNFWNCFKNKTTQEKGDPQSHRCVIPKRKTALKRLHRELPPWYSTTDFPLDLHVPTVHPHSLIIDTHARGLPDVFAAQVDRLVQGELLVFHRCSRQWRRHGRSSAERRGRNRGRWEGLRNRRSPSARVSNTARLCVG